MIRTFYLLSFLLTMSLAAQPAQNSALHALFDNYFEAYLQLNPIYATSIGDYRFNDQMTIEISESHQKKLSNLYREYLTALNKFDSKTLSSEDRLSYELLSDQLSQNLVAMKYPGHLMPITSMNDTPGLLIRLGSGKSLQPFRNVKDYEDFRQRLTLFPAWVDTAIANMNRGIEMKVVQAAPLIRQGLSTWRNQVVDDPAQSSFYAPLRNFPREISWEDKMRLIKEYKETIMTAVVPAYRKLYRYLSNEYLPHARGTLSIRALPDGEDWYRHLVRYYTTTDLSPDDIFDLGMKELRKIEKEMQQTLQKLGHRGSISDYLFRMRSDPSFLIRGGENMIFEEFKRIENVVAEHLPSIFDMAPKAAFEIRAVDRSLAAVSPAAFYMNPTADGSRPGVFYINSGRAAYPRTQMESLFLHEALPGHHFQIALAQEQHDLPRFRRFGYYGAFIEGWGLYAETLGEDLGLYTDPHQYFGMLTYQLLRAARLIADTGLHHKGWDRQETSNALSRHAFGYATFEINRYTAMPGQALSYKIGQLQISELRRKAEKKLKDRFDAKEFHRLILQSGAIPLSMLADKVADYISEKGK